MEIIQIPLTDRQQPAVIIRTRNFFIIDGRLDNDKLRDALERLVRDHWRKLGARLVMGRDGNLEYHLPHTFGEKYELFNWTSKEYDHSIDKIPSLPKATPPEDGITLLPPLQSFEHWFRPSDWPIDRLSEPPDAPLLYISISLFTDATVIATSFPHVLVDQFGTANIMKAWLGLVKGEAPPPMIGFKDDVFANGKPYTDYPLKNLMRKGRHRVRRWGEYPLVVLPFIPELIMNSKEESFTLFLPLPMIQALRERHTKTLTEKYGADPGISNGDIISSILLKFCRMHKKSSRMMTFSQCVNARGRIPQLAGNHDGFIHNALHFSSARFRIDPSTPLNEIAYHNRNGITQALDPEDIDIGLAVTREMVRRGQGTHACEPFDRSFMVTNWSAAWKGLDFTPALEQQEKGQAERDPLKMLILGESRRRTDPGRFSSTILCKTDEGYWAILDVPSKATKLIKEYLKMDPMLENF